MYMGLVWMSLGCILKVYLLKIMLFNPIMYAIEEHFQFTIGLYYLRII